MSKPSLFSLERLLDGWASYVLRYRWLLLLLTLVLCGMSLYYTLNNLGVNTNTAEMLSPDLPFQKNRQRIETAFPQDATAIIFVVEAQTSEETAQAAQQLALKLQAQSAYFESVYIPNDNPFFQQQGLLYLETDELSKLANKLSSAQPFIGYLAKNFHLQGLFELITKALNRQESLPMDLEPLLQGINQAFEAKLQQQPYHLSWQQLLATHSLNNEDRRILVIAKPTMNFEAIFPAEPALLFSRSLIKDMLQTMPTLQIRMTGETALEHEELESVSKGSALAGIFSLILVCSALWFGLRSIKLLLATFLSLIVGLIFTAGFAAVAIGHLNLISIAFAVLYIGLGVDYAIHLCLRYRECRALGMDSNTAIHDSLHSVGLALFLCAFTTSLGFFAFVPTDYSGVSELGLISGAGMFIGLFVSLTILPAFLALFPSEKTQPLQASIGFSVAWVNFPFKYAKSIKVIAFLMTILSIGALTKLTFDSNSIHLRDPHSESVITIKELLKSKKDSPYVLSALRNNLSEAEQLSEQLTALPVVDNVVILTDLVAKNQAEKLAIIEDLDLLIGSQLQQFKNKPSKTDIRLALSDFLAQINTLLQNQPNHQAINSLQKLQLNLQNYLVYADKNPTTAYPALENSVLALLPYTMARLSTSLTATAYTLEDLPPSITKHWLSKEGLYRIRIMPSEDQNRVENQKIFVNSVQAIDAGVTGLSVADQASGDAVVEAFIEAFSGALIAITLLLLLILKSIRNTILVIAPLLLATLLTGAFNVLLDNPFNFANVIALPLLMGMGVDSGIHIMHRLNADTNNSQPLLTTSTARGVFFSSLTTLCSFSSLAFTTHVGTSSMGLLLALGIFFTLICTLIVLPALSVKPVHA
ncbi:MAG: MMPL family transporter [Methylococcales bacterium]|nr:MMPL family transporter [Methylococcales bacterium]